MMIFRLASFWAFTAGIVLYLAQLPPMPGVILMMLGAALLAGLLFHAALIALFIEALTRRVPRMLALVPLLAYGGYYIAYFLERRELTAKEAALRAAAPANRIVFDPTRYSLVHEHADDLVERYAVPAAYLPDRDRAGVYYVHLLVPAAQCDIARDNHLHIWIRNADADQGRHGVCHLSFPKSPPLPIFEVTHQFANRRLVRDQEDITEIRVNGEVRARYVALYTSRLPRLPTFIAGCFLIDSPVSEWRCVFDFARSRVLPWSRYPGFREV